MCDNANYKHLASATGGDSYEGGDESESEEDSGDDSTSGDDSGDGGAPSDSRPAKSEYEQYVERNRKEFRSKIQELLNDHEVCTCQLLHCFIGVGLGSPTL